jgi:tetratricopeptide (TPR) repeat protein
MILPPTIVFVRRSFMQPKKLPAIALLLTTPLLALAQTPNSKSMNDYADRTPPPIADETRRQMEAQLAKAREHYEANPKDPDAIIWLGRRLAYLGRFRDAIEIYTEGQKTFPNDARFYRHRGHRNITIRRFDRAIADFQEAVRLTRGKPDEIEPDGQPNSRNIPTSTLQFNIWYHLGLAYYLTGNHQKAINAYRECLKVSNTPDRLVSTSHWLYMTLRRMNRLKEAAKVLEPVRQGMDVIENEGYYRLLLMYKGILSPDTLLAEAQKQESSAASHSVLYGIGNWYLYNGRREEALKGFRKILSGDQWTSFGYIAAESDLKRLGTD